MCIICIWFILRSIVYWETQGNRILETKVLVVGKGGQNNCSFHVFFCSVALLYSIKTWRVSGLSSGPCDRFDNYNTVEATLCQSGHSPLLA